MVDWIHNIGLAIKKRNQGVSVSMGLQKEWEKAGNTEEDFKVEETLFTDDLARLYRFESKKYPHLEIEIYESSDVLKVRYIEKGR